MEVQKMDFSKKVCKKVREKREKSGRSQMEFAIAIGMSTYHYGEIERQHVNISVDTVNRIAMELNIQPYELLQVDEE
jgi:transcriptional regulator with XRE-family HTH domain